jgi:hypothetical protein
VTVEEAVPSRSPAAAQRDDAPECSAFECNICYDVAESPVVTMCGHLYCWPCLYRCAIAQRPPRPPHGNLTWLILLLGFSLKAASLTVASVAQMDASTSALPSLSSVQSRHRAEQGEDH